MSWRSLVCIGRLLVAPREIWGVPGRIKDPRNGFRRGELSLRFEGRMTGMTASEGFARAANEVARVAGRPLTFALCCAVVIVWALTGPIFDYSDTWQLIINTGTTIITFLMVFLIQNTQNRDGVAIQTKLDEIIRAGQGRNRFVGIERLTEAELEDLRDKCEKRALAELKKTERRTRDKNRKTVRRTARAITAKT
jgi:low affinity Fe/Cu permease